MLPPDATLLIYAYFFLLLYISAAALSVILVRRPPATAAPAMALHQRALLQSATATTTPAATLRTGLEAGMWAPLVSMLHRLSGIAVAGVPATATADYGTLLIGMFLVSLGVPLVLLVWVTASNPASSTILHPAKFMRPTLANLLVISATVAEAVQLSASTFQVCALVCASLPRGSCSPVVKTSIEWMLWRIPGSAVFGIKLHSLSTGIPVSRINH